MLRLVMLMLFLFLRLSHSLRAGTAIQVAVGCELSQDPSWMESRGELLLPSLSTHPHFKIKKKKIKLVYSLVVDKWGAMSTRVLGGEPRSKLMGTKKPRNSLLSSPSSAKLLLLQLICPGSETGRDWDKPCVTHSFWRGWLEEKKQLHFMFYLPLCFLSIIL